MGRLQTVKDQCEHNLHFTFLFADQRGMSFEILNISKSKNNVLCRGGPYPTLDLVNVQETVCNDSNSSFAIKIRDVNLRGLRSESAIGVFGNKGMNWTSNGKNTLSYETIFYIDDPPIDTVTSTGKQDEEFVKYCYV